MTGQLKKALEAAGVNPLEPGTEVVDSAGLKYTIVKTVGDRTVIQRIRSSGDTETRWVPSWAILEGKLR